MQKKTRKLVLGRETLLNLEEASKGLVVGGFTQGAGTACQDTLVESCGGSCGTRCTACCCV